MKTAIIAVGVALFCLSTEAAWAQEIEPAPPPFDRVAIVVTIAEYLKMVEEHGYSSTLDRRSMDHAVIRLEKYGTTEEGHGLFNISWDKRETWTLEFYGPDENLKLLNKNGSVEQKAPWLGKWRAYEPTTWTLALPPELQVTGLVN